MRTYTSNPPQWDEVCCHCGDGRHVYGDHAVASGAHGPYTPGTNAVYRVTLDAEKVADAVVDALNRRSQRETGSSGFGVL